LLSGDAEISYRQLDEQASRVAHVLTGLGIRKGDRVAICLPNVPEFVWSYLGVLKIGAIAVSVNPALTAPELEHVLRDSGAAALIAADDVFGRIGAGFTRLSRMRIGPGTAPGCVWLDELMRGASPDAIGLDLAGSTTAAIVYTSGTTGVPKGATLSHSNVLFTMASKQRYLNITPEDRLLLFLPLFHCFGQNAVMNAGLHSGATLILQQGWNAANALQSIVRDRVTILCAVPTHFIALAGAATAEQMRGVRYFFSAAASLPAEIERSWLERFGRPIHQGYGLTETSPFASCNHVSRIRPGSIGTPIEGVEMAVVDSEGRHLPPGEAGEIVIRGPNVMLGYWNRPEETRDAIRNGWFHTGDIGRVDEAGCFYIIDRLKDMVIVGGINVYPAEVENVLYLHPAVAEAAVYGVPHSSLGESVQATVVLKLGSMATSQELLAHCRARLAPYKLPTSIEFADALPKTGAGKILKRKLRASAAPQTDTTIESADRLEQKMREWIARQTGIPLAAVDPDRPFADYGFTSLLAVQFAAVLGEWLGREISATITWEHATLGALVRGLMNPGASVPAHYQLATRIAALSDEEAEAMLREELEKLEAVSGAR
jgi:long-chain acyl-CoA synthetase